MIHQTAHILLFVAAAAPAQGHSFEDVSRAYRIDTYNGFRTDRTEYDRRQQLGVEAANRWKEARFDKELQADIFQWFVASTAATRNGTELPELPGDPSLASRRAAARQAKALAAAKAAQSASSAEPATQPTSIVSNQGFTTTNDDQATSDTARILGSVGRAITHAFVKGHSLGKFKPSGRPAKFVGESPSEEEGEPTEDELRAIFDGDA